MRAGPMISQTAVRATGPGPTSPSRRVPNRLPAARHTGRVGIMRTFLPSSVLLLALTACGSPDEDPVEDAADQVSVLQDAADACADEMVGNFLQPDDLVATEEFIEVLDEGETLTVNGGDQFQTVPAGECVLNELDVPESVKAKMAATTAMMGSQTDSFDDYELTWSFHPDSGLNLVVEQQ